MYLFIIVCSLSAYFARILAEVANVLDKDSPQASVSVRGFEDDLLVCGRSISVVGLSEPMENLSN